MSHQEYPELWQFDPFTFPSISLVRWLKAPLHPNLCGYSELRVVSCPTAKETCDKLKTKNMLWALRNALAKWHHQLRVCGMILHSVMLWKTTSEPDTCTQESRGKAVSFRSAKSQFGKWLKKPFFTLISQRLIDLMRTRLFYERNFIGQLAFMEEMERYVFLWPWSTTGWTEELLLAFQQHRNVRNVRDMLEA